MANILFLTGSSHAVAEAWDQAAEQLEICQTRLIELTNEHPDDVRSLELLANVRLGLGAAVAATGNGAAAARYGSQALSVTRKLVREDSDNEDLLILHASALRDLGTWQRDSGQRREGLANLAEARGLFESLLESQPGNERIRICLDQTAAQIAREPK